MEWDKLLKLALEQSAAFLLGLLVVYVIDPDTLGGALLLIVVVLAIYNVCRQVIAWFRRRPADRPS